MPANPFKRLILRAVLRDMYPMVIRLVAIPDTLYLTDFDDIFHAVLGWDSGIGYAFQIQGQEFNSFQRKNESASRSGVSIGWKDARKPLQAPDSTCCSARRVPHGYPSGS